MDEAAKLLRDTSLPLKEVSAEVGIDDIYYFAKSFQKHYEIPSGTHRKTFR